MWTIQEIVLAQGDKVMFYCGQRMLRLELLSIAVDFSGIPGLNLSLLHWNSYTGLLRDLKRAVDLKARARPLPQSFTITALLASTLCKQATMPVDKIFGLYGIARHFGWHLPTPDYNKPVSQVFLEATQFAMGSDQSLGILNFSGGPTSIPDLPSWAVDFGRLPIGTVNPTKNFAAARDSGAFFWFDETGRQITVMGRKVDVISGYGRPLEWDSQNSIYTGGIPAPDMQEKAWIRVQQWMYVVQQLQQGQQSINPGGESLDQAFARTLFMDNTSGLDAAEITRLYSILRTQAQSSNPQYFANPEWGIAMEHVLRVSIGKALAFTEGQRLAMVPATTRINDVVGIFAGSKVPSILRQQGERFLLVGSAYVDGVMHGESWTEHPSDLQEFTLV